MAEARASLLSRVRLLATHRTVARRGSSVRGILQARILEWVAVSSSRGSSWHMDGARTSSVSCTAGGFCTCWVILARLKPLCPLERLHIHAVLHNGAISTWNSRSQRALIMQSGKFSSYFPFFCSSHGHGFGVPHNFSSGNALVLNTLLKSVLQVTDHRNGQL